MRVGSCLQDPNRIDEFHEKCAVSHFFPYSPPLSTLCATNTPGVNTHAFHQAWLLEATIRLFLIFSGSHENISPHWYIYTHTLREWTMLGVSPTRPHTICCTYYPAYPELYVCVLHTALFFVLKCIIYWSLFFSWESCVTCYRCTKCMSIRVYNGEFNFNLNIYAAKSNEEVAITRTRIF